MATAEIDTITGFISPSIHDGELRILDTDLAARLGFDRPRDIRKLIKRYVADLRQMGRCATVARRPEAAYFSMSSPFDRAYSKTEISSTAVTERRSNFAI
ncbi:hypothetical protein [Sorlinia euscelidii]|uniref:hypothetical protein n=1 Tax=Sorlinia euscelidii TaxID=3081148 RepID=UPI00374E1D8E